MIWEKAIEFGYGRSAASGCGRYDLSCPEPCQLPFPAVPTNCPACGFPRHRGRELEFSHWFSLKWHGHLGHEFARAEPALSGAKGCPCHLKLNQYLNFVPMRIPACRLMPNHGHRVLYPRADGGLSKFLRRIPLTHTQRYHAKTRTVGYGHVYQGC